MKLSLSLVLFLILTTCKSSNFENQLSEVEKQKARDELCGVELYKEREDRICGEIYLIKATPACGVYRWKECNDKRCKGYIEYSEYYVRNGRKSDLSCKDGYDLRNVEDLYETYTSRSDADYGSTRQRHVGYGGKCIRDEYIPKCRASYCGVESYKNCRHPTHGIERFGRCRSAQFGVESYKECEFYKNPEQALALAQRISGDIPMMSTHLLVHKGNYFANTRNQLALACHIKRYESDDLYAEIIRDLKLKFQAIYGVEFQSNDYNCNEPNTDMQKEDCAAGEKTPRCQSLVGYKAALLWFTENISDLGLILDDLTVHNAIQNNKVIDEVKAELTKVVSREDARSNQNVKK